MANSQPRGIRNNNPLNLRISNNPWLGKVEHNTDGAFEQFITIQHGIRAAMKNIRTICRRYPGCTMSHLISIWAPPSDRNNTREYVRQVKIRSAIMPDEKILPLDRGQMCRLTRAMAEVECGRSIEMKTFEEAFDMI